MNADVLNALNERLLSYDSGSWNDRIELMNSDDFQPPDQGLYVKQLIRTNDPIMLGSGPEGHYRIRGNYILNIMVPKGHGVIPAYKLADGISNHFRRGITLTKNSSKVTIEKSYVGFEAEDASYTVVGVTVHFYTYELY